MKWLAIAVAIGSLVACSDSGGPTAPTATPANVAGSYNATFTASSTCSASLPSDARSLFFIATLTQTGSTVQAQLVGHQGGTVTVSGTVSGQTLSLPSLSFNETVGRGATLTASGSGSVGSNGSITGTVNGTYQVPAGSSCVATNHQLQMVKLCSQQTSTGTALVPCA